MNEKIITLRKNMEMLGIDGLIVNNPNNIKYLLGVNAEGALLINTKENFFITDARYVIEAKEYAKNCEVIESSDLIESSKEILRKNSIIKIINFNGELKAKTNHKMVRPAGVEPASVT